MPNRAGWMLLACAVAGAFMGTIASAAPTRACSCSGPSWALRLREVTSTDPADTHRRLWPESASLAAGGTSMNVFARSTGGEVFQLVSASP